MAIKANSHQGQQFDQYLWSQ